MTEAASAAVPARITNPVVASLAASAVAAGALGLAAIVGWRQAALFVVGTLAGLVLYHAAFGFTSAWRIFLTDRRSAGLRAQMVMLGVACLVFVPLISSGTVFGQSVRGSAAPLGVALIAGSFLFGIGMQLGGGCASGTLYSAGGGSTRMFVTLAFFVVGSLLGTAHAPFWDTMPATPAVSLLALHGPFVALLFSLGAMAIVFGVSLRLERQRHGRAVSITTTPGAEYGRWWGGPWPLLWGALGLAAINVATLALAGRPWGVTSAFALWGAKAAAAMGVDVASWPYWSVAARAQSLSDPLIFDITSVMNIGIMLGALAAAALAGRFSPVLQVPARSLMAAAIGGLLLGYGARLASGCNIGAYFSGVASTSLHGWLWFACAFAGNWFGARLRPVFGLGR